MSLDPKGATTLIDVMRRRAALTPQAQYFSLFDDTVTYARLWAQSGRYAAGLAAAGVRPGDKVCLIYPTCAEFFYTFFGAVRLGAIPVPLSITSTIAFSSLCCVRSVITPAAGIASMALKIKFVSTSRNSAPMPLAVALASRSVWNETASSLPRFAPRGLASAMAWVTISLRSSASNTSAAPRGR